MSHSNQLRSSEISHLRRRILIGIGTFVVAVALGWLTFDHSFSVGATGNSSDMSAGTLNETRVSRKGRSRPAQKEVGYQRLRERYEAAGLNDPGQRVQEAQAPDGVDTSFNAKLEDGYTRVEVVAAQPDGKILVGGSYPRINGLRRFGLNRLNADGTVDATFNPGDAGPRGGVYSITVLTDGKILIGGTFTAYNGVSRNRVARLNPDGSLDLSFDPGVGANSTVFEVQALPGGGLVAAGAFTQFNGSPANRIVRLDAFGRQDTSFTAPTFSNSIEKAKIQQDGRIIVAGPFSNVGGISRFGIARLNVDGSHDTSFVPASPTGTSATEAIAIQADGKILYGGGYNDFFVRLNSDGSLDPTFNPPIQPGSTTHSIIVLADGKLLVGGFLDDGTGRGFAVVKLNQDGSLDNSFSPEYSDTYYLEVFSMALTPTGKIVGGGDIYHIGNSQSKHIFQLESNGAIDTAFTTSIEGDALAYATARQTDGKLIVAGTFRKVNDTPRDNLVRLNPDGSIDPSFVGVTDGNIYAVALQPDGKVLIGGQFSAINGVNATAGRLNPNGTLDPTFNFPADVDATFVERILVQPDGKIIGTGQIFTPRANTGATAVYRVNSDGSDDTTFSLLPYRGVVYDAVLQNDGHIYIGGTFTNLGGLGVNRVAKLNVNGTLDTSFATGTGPNSTVYSIVEQADNKVLVGGFFTGINGHYAPGIARLLPTGSIDPAFDPGLGVNGSVYTIAIRPDTKIDVGGSFSLFNNVARTNLVRLSNDGILDPAFTDQTMGYVNKLYLQPDGKIVIAGGFIAVNGMTHLGIARLSEADLTPPSNDNFDSPAVLTGLSGTASGNNTNATAEPGEPAHAGVPAAHSIWYKWTATDTGLFSFTTSGSSLDTTMGVYTGNSVSTLTQIAANDDSASFDQSSRVVFHADAGAQYYIAIDGKNDSVGVINLIYRQAARTYRFYAQTGNGFISPRTPTIIATRQSDGSQYTAQIISPGVFELDLPVDNDTYLVSIGGTDLWSPNSFTIDNSGRPTARNNNTGQDVPLQTDSGNLTLVVNAVTVAATITGQLQGVTSANGVTVFRGSEGGPNPIPATSCSVFEQSGTVGYSCQFIVDTLHQIKPSLNGVVFAPLNRSYPLNPPSEDPSDLTKFVANTGPTYSISGMVTANGVPLSEATVQLSGHKVNSYFTSEDGHYEFDNLPPGGPYHITAVLEGYTFASQTIEDLQSNQVLNVNAQTGCSYSLSLTQMGVSAQGGEAHIRVNTDNGCPWGTTNNVPWITVTRGTGNGTGDMYFNTLPSQGPARSTTLTVAGQQFTIEQANGCTYAFAGGTHSFPAAGGSSSINVTSSDAQCQGPPAATDYCMISSLALDQGTHLLNFTVSNNFGVARNGTIQLGDQSFAVDQAAAPGDHRTKFDFDGDGKADVSVFRPSEGAWYIYNSSIGVTGRNFGINGDIQVAADYDGDGEADIAVYRPAEGLWFRIFSSNDQFDAYPFGLTGDIPVPADYDGDGKDDIAVFRPSDGTWYLLLPSGVQAIPFGAAEDKPVVGDYDGDHKADIAVYRPSQGAWYMLNSTAGFQGVQFGLTGDVPIPRDYDGDGKTDVAVYRESSLYWYRLNSSNGAFVPNQFGLPGDKPVPADYNGDSFADIAMYRPSNGYWYIWSCTGNGAITSTPFGTATDVPVPYPGTP